VISFVLARAAYADLEDIENYTLETWGEAQRDRYISGLFEKFDAVAANPALGRSRPELAEGVRSLPHEQHVIFYEIIGERCHILRVLHHARDVAQQFP
jgi:toxin ParE1/3/4